VLARPRHGACWLRPSIRGVTSTRPQRTRRRDYAVLRLVFEFAVGRVYRPDNPVRAVKKPPRGDERQANVLTPEQVESLLNAAKHHPMLWLFILTCAELASAQTAKPSGSGGRTWTSAMRG